MKDFKKRLQENTTKLIDEKIQSVLEIKFNNLEKLADVEAYKNQISLRKNGIIDILNNFDYYMDIIDDQKRYTYASTSNKKHQNAIVVLDKIIKRIITEALEHLYASVSSTSIDCNKERSQILDRQLKIIKLLDNYDDNIKILEEYRKKSKNSDFEQIIH